jgi:DNA-binding XRE family transcriptional regulator
MNNETDEPERAGLHMARNLISLRQARTLTLDAAAAIAALLRSTIANLESGEANPSLPQPPSRLCCFPHRSSRFRSPIGRFTGSMLSFS